MTNTLKLKAAIVESGLTRKKIAEILGISLTSLQKKIHNTTEFKASEIDLLARTLSITDLSAVFFASDVAEKGT